MSNNWNKQDRAKRKQAVVDQAFRGNIFGPQTKIAAVMDFDGLSETIHQLRHALPKQWRHRFAIKANPLIAVIRHLSELDMEMEAASAGEIAACTTAGIAAAKISYNSPVKSTSEILDCLERKISISIDNEIEFQRCAEIIRDSNHDSKIALGFRINTQVGEGNIALTSTAHPTSKFGYPIQDTGSRAKLVKFFTDCRWLNMLHVHTGSQGVPLETMLSSIAQTVELAKEINASTGRDAVKIINIGGGLPINYDPEHKNISFQEYAAALSRAIPSLFSGDFLIETEFGRSIVAENGFLLAQVEYTKIAGGRLIAATHAGSQIAVRTVLAPKDWPLWFSVLDSNGKPKTGPTINVDLAGPCCFGGDLLCRNTPMTKPEPGDFVLIHNTGAYTFTGHYDFNLLPRPAVYSASGSNDAIAIECIRKAQTLSSICQLLQ